MIRSRLITTVNRQVRNVVLAAGVFATLIVQANAANSTEWLGSGTSDQEFAPVYTVEYATTELCTLPSDAQDVVASADGTRYAYSTV